MWHLPHPIMAKGYSSDGIPNLEQSGRIFYDLKLTEKDYQLWMNPSFTHKI